MRFLAPATMLIVAGALHAQPFSTSTCPPESNYHWDDTPQACELRRTTLSLVNGGVIVTGENGGVDLIGEDRQDVLLEARIVARSSSQAAADTLLREVTILTDGSIRAKGPSTVSSQPSWYVSFTLHVPRHVNAELNTHNGGINLSHVEGKLTAETHNGGIAIADLGGDVHLLTVNGGLSVDLSGTHWVGSALSARTTNGGIAVQAPAQYSAHLITQTEHGGTSINFPITVQGSIGKRIDTSLGQGGATIEFITVNGGVSIDKS